MKMTALQVLMITLWVVSGPCRPARCQGQVVGRKRALSPEQIEQARERMAAEGSESGHRSRPQDRQGHLVPVADAARRTEKVVLDTQKGTGPKSKLSAPVSY